MEQDIEALCKNVREMYEYFLKLHQTLNKQGETFIHHQYALIEVLVRLNKLEGQLGGNDLPTTSRNESDAIE
jgi:hypothetical protein